MGATRANWRPEGILCCLHKIAKKKKNNLSSLLHWRNYKLHLFPFFLFVFFWQNIFQYEIFFTYIKPILVLVSKNCTGLTKHRWWQITRNCILFYFILVFPTLLLHSDLSLACSDLHTTPPPSPKRHCVVLQNTAYTTQLWLWLLSSYIKWPKVWMHLFVTQLFWDSLLAGSPFISTSSRIAFLSKSKFSDDHQGFALWSVMFSMHRNQRHCTFLFVLFGYIFSFCCFK